MTRITMTSVAKEARHVIAVVMMPPIRGPEAEPRPAAALTTPKAYARSLIFGIETVTMM